MTHTTPPERKALTAIAAVLALLSTPAFAQDASLPPPDVTTVSPVIVPEAPPAPTPSAEPTTQAAPVVEAPPPVQTFAAPSATVQPLPPTPQPETAIRENRTARSAPVARAAPARDVAPVVRNTPPAPVLPQPSVDPGLSGSTPPAEIRTPGTTQPALARDANGPNFMIVMGAAALALLVGFASLGFLYRGDRRRATSDKRAARGLPTAWAEPRTPEPAVVKPAARSKDATRLEAMVNKAPSADNPFLTRTKRLRRANFILATGHAPERLAMPARQVAAKEQVVAAPVERKQAERKQPVAAVQARRPAKSARTARSLIPAPRHLKPATS